MPRLELLGRRGTNARAEAQAANTSIASIL
jgi:hypothetical protein